MLHRLKIALSLAAFGLIPIANAADTVYVDLNAAGLNNGSSWTDAYTQLQTAATNANADAVILVAKGTYRLTSTMDRFEPKSGQLWFGGFNAGDGFHLRNPKDNPTILSGDVNNNSAIDFGIDAQQILLLNNLLQPVRIEGFTITGAANNSGNGGGVVALNTSIVLANCTVSFNEVSSGDGAGFYGSSATGLNQILACVFFNNRASTGKGGAIFQAGQSVIANSLIYQNDAADGGGVFLNASNTDAKFFNNTVMNNTGGVTGILYQKNGSSTLAFRNCVVWNNIFASTDGVLVNSADTLDVAFCLTAENNLTNKNSNISADPQLDANYSPLKCSPTLDKGDNVSYLAASLPLTDLLGNNRLFDGTFDGNAEIDLGAVESAIICEACTTQAGIDQSICGLSTTLAAQPAGFQRTGTWSQVSGPGTANFANVNQANTSLTVDLEGTYVFEWSLVGPDCSVADRVTVQFAIAPIANAGPDSTYCGQSGVLAARPSRGFGLWTAVTAGLSFGNNTQANSGVTVSSPGFYTAVWSETNGGCPVSRDTVVHEFKAVPVPFAGNDSTVCGFTFNLKAVPTVGTGTWSLLNGPGTANFVNSNLATTSVTVNAAGVYQFQWSELQSPCAPIADVVNFTVRQQPIANAGFNFDTCGTVARLAAVPSAGTGTWSFVSGPGSALFNQANNPGTTVAVSQIGQYIFRWTESNGPVCSTSSAEVLVDFSPAAQVTLQGIGNKYCDANEELKINISITGFPPFNFVVESAFSKDTITTSSGAYQYSDSGVTKGASQVNYFISRFVDGNGCPANIVNNLISFTRQGPDLQPGFDGFYTNNDTICTGNSAVLTLNYFNNEALTFVIEDVAKGNTFTVNYTNGLLNIPVNNLVYGINRFRINSVIRNNGGCPMGLRGSTEVVIVYKPVTFDIIGNNLTCFESGDGSLFLTNAVGASDWTQANLNGVPNSDLRLNFMTANLAAGTYSVRIVNNAKCELTKSRTLQQPGPINYTYTINNVTCFGLSNGNVDIFTTGGYGQLSINFNGNVQSGPFKFNNLRAGTYPVRIIDDITGCVVFADSVVISQPDSLTLTTLPIDVNCDGTNKGSITLFPQGGTAPYTAQVVLGSFQSTVPAFNPSFKVTNLSQGVYTTTVRDNKGCSAVARDTIRLGEELSFNVVKIKDAQCGTGGTIAIIGGASIAGTLFSIDNVNFGTDTLFRLLSPGIYNVYGRAPSGCTRAYTIEIKELNSPFTAAAFQVKPVTCSNGNDGIIRISMNGGSGDYRIIFNNGIPQKDSVFTGLSAGTYNFRVFDIGCGQIIDLSFTLTNPVGFNVSVSARTNPSCSDSKDGSLRLTAGSQNPGNYQFSIDNGQNYQFGNQFNFLGKGTYSIYAKDGAGCVSNLLTTTLTAPDSLRLNTLVTNDFVTRTSDITLSGLGGTPPYTYSINQSVFTPNNIFNDVPFAFLVAEILDSKGCTNRKTLALGDVSIADLQVDLGIQLYPNPADNILRVKYPSTSAVTGLQAFNLVGQMIWSSPQAQTQISVETWPAGAYIVKIFTTDGVQSQIIQVSH